MNTDEVIQPGIYGRVSSDRQEEADTIASQLAALRARVSQDKLSLREDLCFIDDGYSGTTLIRPALDRLRDAAAAGILNRLYIHSPDRLARKYAYQVLLVDEFQRCGVEVVFLNRPLDGSAEDQLLLQVQGMIAEYERAKLLERCRRGKLHAAQQGCVSALASAPYGYRYIRKTDGGGVARFDIVLEEARVVRQVFDWVGRDRLTLGEVCRRLRAQGIQTKTGNENWDRRTILDMLRHPAYKGTAEFGRTQVGPRRPRLRPARGQPEQPRRPYSVYDAEERGIPIAVPALVGEELFDAAAQQLEENRDRQRQSRRGACWLLQGLLVCRHCGYALYGLGTRHRLANGNTVEHSYYRCTGRNGNRFGGQRLCENRQVRVDDLDEAVWKDVCQLLREPAKVQAEYQRRVGEGSGKKQSFVEDQARTPVDKGSVQPGPVDRQLSGGPAGERRIRASFAGDKGTTGAWEAESKEIEEQRDQDRASRLALQGLEDFGERVQAGLTTASWHERREIIRALVKRVEVGIEKICVVYRVSPPPFVTRPRGGAFEHCGELVEPALPDVT